MTKDQTPSREEVIRWAREAGFEPEVVLEGPYAPYAQEWLNNMQRFAALVAAAEREACAKIADRYHIPMCDTTADAIAAAIRARKENT